MRGHRRNATFPCLTNWLRWQIGRQAVALLIVTGILNVHAAANSAAPKLNSRSAIGTVSVEGDVQVNGSTVISGQTLFSASSIRTSTEAESTLELSNLARLRLEAETSMKLEFSELGLSASLDNGTVHVLVPGGIQADITTSDALIVPDAGQLAVFSLLADSCTTTLSVQTGRVEIRSGNNVRSVAPGESVSTGGAPSPSPAQHNFSKGKKIGLTLAIGGAIAILLIALRGEKPVEEMPGGGCVIVPSGPTVGGC